MKRSQTVAPYSTGPVAVVLDDDTFLRRKAVVLAFVVMLSIWAF